MSTPHGSGLVERTLLCTAVLFGVMAVVYWRYSPDPSLGVLFYFVNDADAELTSFTVESVEDVTLPEGAHVSVIIHGYTESAQASWIKPLYNAYLKRHPNSVVIVVDYWHYTSVSRVYMSRNIHTVAQRVAHMLTTLERSAHVSLSDVHLLCFSLGCRVTGEVKQYLNTSNNIGRITGIDPSIPWPGYKPTLEPDDYLDDTDALLVTILRTSVISSTMPSARRDFIFNGGLCQPGCYSWYLPNMFMNICSHYRSHKYVVEALNDPEAFPSCPCEQPDSQQCSECQSPVHFLDQFIPEGRYNVKTISSEPYSIPLPLDT